MYQVLPTDTNQSKEPLVKKVESSVNRMLTGSARKAFGLYDFLIMLVVSANYFFFTGLALVLGRKLPGRWLEIGYTLGEGRVIEGLKRIKDKKKSSKGSGRAVTLKDTPNIDLLND